jgi:hypothetical protein
MIMPMGLFQPRMGIVPTTPIVIVQAIDGHGLTGDVTGQVGESSGLKTTRSEMGTSKQTNTVCVCSQIQSINT